MPNTNEVKICRTKFETVLYQRCEGTKEFERLVGCGNATIQKIFNGEPILRRTLNRWCKLLNIRPEGLLEDLPAAKDPKLHFCIPAPPRWEIAECISGVITAPNEIQFQRFKLKHASIPEHLGLGKFYNLVDAADSDREETNRLLERHPHVMAKCSHPNVAKLYDVFRFERDAAWWVIEEWEEGVWLDELIRAEERLE
ncbi:MAG: hypothetical protein AAGG44_08590, partial [Planctomycetota bacterium]